MLDTNDILNILTIDAIKDFDKDKIEKIKKLSKENFYRLIGNCSNSYVRGHILINGDKKVTELSQSALTCELSDEEKILFRSEIRFINDNEIIDIINRLFTIDELADLNNKIDNIQSLNANHVMRSIELERKYNLDEEQVKRILKLKTILQSKNYKFNCEDIKTYAKARQFDLENNESLLPLNDAVAEINDNEVLKKLKSLGKNYFNLDENSIYLLINRINEIIVSYPELLNIMDKDKTYTKGTLMN